MLQKKISPRAIMDSTGATLEHPLQRAPAGMDKINREWLGLRELTYYASVSERTLRSWIYSPVDPLPAVKVSGKVLVRKSDFDAFLQRHRIRPLEEIDIDAIVQDVLKGGVKGR
jgi:hypothetical protein